MANIITTSNMGLPLPVPGIDPGPDYAQNNNVSFQTIDVHNHTSGKGLQIPPGGLNINSDLPFNGNNLTLLKTIRFQAQSAPISGVSPNLNCLYAVSADLYFNDGNGNQVRITSGGTVNATSSGISSGTATASFVGSVLVVNAAALTPANVQCASILLGNNIASSNYLTLSPPNAMPSSYGLTLPSLPASQKIMTLDNSGNITAPYTVDGNTITITSNVIQLSPTVLAAPTVQIFTSGSGTYTLPSNVRWIKVTLVGGGGGGSVNGLAGANGSATTFGSSLLTANGGSAGTAGNDGGTGGSATINSPAYGLALSGGYGSGVDSAHTGTAGGMGGINPLGGGASGGSSNKAGVNGVTNTGAGGGGGGGATGASNGGAGGGAGGYIKAIIPSPSATYSYTIGAGGAGASSANPGGNGAAGIIIVEESYI